MKNVQIAWTDRSTVDLMGKAPVYAGTPSDSQVGKVTVVQQEWHRAGKTMLANVTLDNRNGFSVKNVIVNCEIMRRLGSPRVVMA